MPARAKARVVESDSDVEQVVSAPASKRPVKRKSPVGAADAGPSKRKAIAPTDAVARLKAENKKLKELLDQQTDLNKELVELRMTEPEARVGELTDAAEERRLQFTKQNDLYKDEIKELKKQVREFEDAEKARLAEAKPAGAGADVGRLKAENESLQKQLKQAEKRVEPRSAPAVDRSADGRGADARVEELEAQGAIVSSRDGVDRAVAQLRRELDTETAQSKVLQQRMQAQRTADQSGDETKLINELLADLTGLIVTSVVRNPSQGIHVTYHCVLADSRPRNKPGTVRLSLRFMLSFDSEQCLAFEPVLDEHNDAAIIDRLKAIDETWLKMIRFSRTSSPQFFRKLLLVVFDGPKKA